MPDPDAQNADTGGDIEVGGVSLGPPATEPTATEGAWATAGSQDTWTTAASQDTWAAAPGTSTGDSW